MFLKGEFSNRLVQVSLFAAIVYYITAYPVVFENARKYFPIKFKKTHHLLIFHTFVFMVLMYVLTYFVFDPLVKVVEGSNDPPEAVRLASGKRLPGPWNDQPIKSPPPAPALPNTPDKDGKCNGDPLPFINEFHGGYENPMIKDNKYISKLYCRSDKGYMIDPDLNSDEHLVCTKDGWTGTRGACISM